mmetsp:Transcript_16208/g.39626  ORF Transcript_16208/g.39626 Transcript_16208/m.39626 type:complete len:105 (-) Transcript_16208:254-568(-)
MRAEAKADDDYAHRRPGPGVSWLYDIVRASILFSDADQIAACLEILHSNPSIHIATARNRFAKPTLTGYRDLKFCVQMTVRSTIPYVFFKSFRSEMNNVIQWNE